MVSETFKISDPKLFEGDWYINNLRTSPEQIDIINRIAKVLKLYLDGSLDIIKGYIGKVLYDWQEANSIDISYFSTAEPKERISNVEVWFNDFKKLYLINNNVPEDEKENLDTVIEIAFAFYQEKYAYR